MSKNNYFIIILVVLFLVCVYFMTKTEKVKSKFGNTCSGAVISFNGVEKCYPKGDYRDESWRFNRVGNVQIKANGTNVQWFARRDFDKYKGTVGPNQVRNFIGWPWSFKVF